MWEQIFSRVRLPRCLLALASMFAFSTSAYAATERIECWARFEDNAHNFVHPYESFSVVVPDDSVGRMDKLEHLRNAYSNALQEHPIPSASGFRLDKLLCEYTSSPETRTGSIGNRYGGTTTFVPTPDLLRGGKGYVSTGKPPPKPTSTPSGSNGSRAPAMTTTAPQPAPKGWTPEQVNRAREAAAAQAKALADAKRNEAETRARIGEFLEELRKRGSAQ